MALIYLFGNLGFFVMLSGTVYGGGIEFASFFFLKSSSPVGEVSNSLLNSLVSDGLPIVRVLFFPDISLFGCPLETLSFGVSFSLSSFRMKSPSLADSAWLSSGFSFLSSWST